MGFWSKVGNGIAKRAVKVHPVVWVAVTVGEVAIIAATGGGAAAIAIAIAF